MSRPAPESDSGGDRPIAADEPQDNTDGSASAAKGPARKTRASPSVDEVHGPSPNLATNLAIADIALRGGSVLARRAIERTFLGSKYSPRKVRKILKGRTMTEALLHSALARVALRSVPGAILVGGALVAKTLYDRSRARDAKREGDAALDEMARDDEAS